MFEDTSEWVVFYELVFTTKEYMRNIIEIDPKWLIDIAPHYYKQSDIEEKENEKKKKLKIAPIINDKNWLIYFYLYSSLFF